MRNMAVEMSAILVAVVEAVVDAMTGAWSKIVGDRICVSK
jgi:Flp pilus assembly pilin Flp